MAYSDVILASSPVRYWPLNETSGATAADLVGGVNLAATGLVMGGGAGPDGIGGVAPVFTGTEYLSRAGNVLGGAAAWTVEAWVFYLPVSAGDSTPRAFYGEMGSSGNDSIQARMNGGSSTQMQHVYGDDAAQTQINANTIFVYGAWTYVVMTRSGSTVEMWWNAGRRTLSTGGQAGSTWTNAGQAVRVGMTPRGTNPWVGRIAHAAAYNRVLTGADILAHYEAGTPLTRPLISAPLWQPDAAVWNQRLDDPANPPDLAAGSAAMVTKLANQVTAYGASLNDGGGPIYLVDNTTPTQAVRILGGTSNVSDNPPDLYNALQTVPIPAGMVSSTSVDNEVTIYNTDADRLYEFWHMVKTLLAPQWASATISGAGTIPAGTYDYLIVPALSDNTEGNYIGTSPAHTVVNGSQGVQLDWDVSDGAAKYRIYRSTAGFSPLSNYKLIATVTAPTQTYTDTGAAAGVAYAGLLTAVTSDWACSYAGVLDDVSHSLGRYEAPHANWGAAATSLPLMAGTVTLEEGMARDIPHAVAMALAEVDNTGRVYPAQRNDGFGGANAIQEATRFQLDPAYDTSTISNLFTRAIAVAFQKYGGYVRDVAGAVTGAYVEDTQDTGRNFHPAMFGGLHGFEVFAGFPWSSMRAIDPAWTQGGAVAIPLFEDVTDDFANGAIDSPPWTATAGVTETAGHLSIATSIAYSNATTIPARLTDSEFALGIVSVPWPQDEADQSGVRLFSGVDASGYIDFRVQDNLLVAEYTDSFAGVHTQSNSVPYSASNHQALRIRESGGTIYWETWNGAAWSLLTSLLWAVSGWPAVNLDSMTAMVYSGNFNAVVGRPAFVVDNVNAVAPGAVGTPVLVVVRPDLWPDGTVVSAYSALAVVGDRPTGAAAESVTAAAGSVSFTTLVAGTAYVLHAVVGGQSRILRVRVQSVSAAALGRATGTGNMAAGSLSVSNVVTVTGAFQVGQRVMGPGIEPLTRIKAISGSTLTLTNAAKVTGAGVSLEASDAITAAGRILRRRAAIGTS